MSGHCCGQVLDDEFTQAVPAAVVRWQHDHHPPRARSIAAARGGGGWFRGAAAGAVHQLSTADKSTAFH